MNCKFCGKVFNHGFNLRRHENDYCSLKNQERETFETESSQTMESEDDALTDSTRGSESPVSSDNESETEEDPWMPLVDEAMQKHKTAFEEMKINLMQVGLDEQSAGEEAYSNILPTLQKDLEIIYKDRLFWMKKLKSDPVHRKIMQTKDDFVSNDNFDPEEAVEAAVEKRKFLFKRLLKDYTFTDSDDEDN